MDGARLAVLMDIRDELKHLNRTLDCRHFQNVPQKLERIARAAARIRTLFNEAKDGRPST